MSHSKRRDFVVYELRHIRDWDRNISGIVYTDKEKQFGWVPSYCHKEQLINRLAINKVYCAKEEMIVNNLANDMTQIRPEWHSVKGSNIFGYYSTVEYRSVFFIGKISNDEIVRVDYEKIKEAVNTKENKLRLKREKRRKHYKKYSFEFRQGPVENIGHSKWHRGSYYRIPSLHCVKVANCSCEEETKAFEKAKYKVKNLPVFDDRIRHKDRSWKTQHKVKKQWMKHLDSHADSIKYTNSLEDTYLEDDFEIAL